MQRLIDDTQLWLWQQQNLKEQTEDVFLPLGSVL